MSFRHRSRPRRASFRRRWVVESLEPRRLLSVGPDGYGYVAAAQTFQNIDLVPGATGVITALDGQDNGQTFIALGANSFNLYGVTYTGATALWINSNGLITFGSGTTSPDNTDLSTGPTQAAIAPLWDDWVTNFATTAAGAANDAVLYQFDGPNNRLIIEWNHVRRFGFTAFDDVTFQAILQLNTGAIPGTITFNYPDVSIGHAWYDNGADATVGIKPAGAPGFTNLLVEQNNGVSGLVTSGSAVQTTWHASPISGRVFQDNNGDGAFTSGEPGLAGATVFIDSNANGTLDVSEPASTTSASGDYAFPNLIAGSYQLRQVAIAGQLAPAPIVVTTAPGSGQSNVDFANIPTRFTGTAAADNYLLRLDLTASHYEIYFNDVPTYTIDVALVPVLTFDLAGGDDSLTIDNIHGNVLGIASVVYDGGAHSPGGGDGLVILGAGGNDVIQLDGAAPLSFTNIERVTVNGNGGNDTLAIQTPQPIAVTLDGGAGADGLFYSATESADLIDIATASIVGGGHSARFLNTESITLFALGGSDLIHLNSTAPGVTVTLDAGAGDDSITIGAGVLDAIPGSVIVTGGDGVDSILLDDHLSTNSYQYFLSGNTFDRDFFGSLAWFTAEQVTLSEAGGNNPTSIEAPAAKDADDPAQLIVNGNGGDDVLTVSGASAPFIIFNGGMNPSDHDVLNVSGATFTFLQDASLGTANLTLNVAADGEVLFYGSQNLAALNITGRAAMAPHGARYLHTKTLSLAPSASLDLADNDLIVEVVSFTTIRSLVFAGFGNTTGINSSTSDGSQILALFDNALIGASDWLGAPLTPNSIVGKYTYFGDVNFDGQVTGDDYTIIDSNLNTIPPAGIAWLSGDSNLDGIVTGDDYTTIDSNLGLGAANPLAPLALAHLPRRDLTAPEA